MTIKKLRKQAFKDTAKTFIKPEFRKVPVIKSTPKDESERVLISFQGSIVEAVITDRSSCGKYMKLTINGTKESEANTWREISTIKVVSKFS